MEGRREIIKCERKDSKCEREITNKIFNQAEIEYIKSHYKGTPFSELLNGLKEEFGKEFKLNMNQLEGDIATFHGKTVEAANKHSKAIVWKQIAEMSGMDLVPEERFVNTYAGRFLVTQYTWRRDE